MNKYILTHDELRALVRDELSFSAIQEVGADDTSAMDNVIWPTDEEIDSKVTSYQEA